MFVRDAVTGAVCDADGVCEGGIKVEAAEGDGSTEGVTADVTDGVPPAD